mmetsp:Transcript_30728/g.74881  ORF Transcript_30728/g.74881 Transcript_30728/m.74881 type:complete len:250 (-) Transcript_30728:1679-2428(-)
MKDKKKLYTISTLNKKLDIYLKGGFECGSITELYGENKSGKSQLCHILCVSALKESTLNKSPKKVIYIDTEGSFRPERLIEISRAVGSNIELMLKNIFYAKSANTEQLTYLLTAAATIAAYSNVILLIVDSATSLFRTDFTGRGELFLRQSTLTKFLKNLNRIADEFNIAILITNQVVAANLDGNAYYGQTSIKPIGGNIMGHFTDTRIWLRKSSGNTRTLKIISSPKIPELEIKFRICSGGINDINIL